MSTTNKSEYVTGPMNLVRMEGTVHGIKKVLYIFFDFHLPITYETICEDMRAKEIHNMLAEAFDNIKDTDKMYDFFMEIYPFEISRFSKFQEEYKQRDKYLLQARKILAKNFVYDKDKNVVGRSKEFPNVRFHYIDIRDYLNSDAKWKILPAIENNINNNYRDNYMSIQDLQNITDSIKMVASNASLLCTALYNELQTIDKIVPTIPKDYEDYNKYTNKQIDEKSIQLINKMKTNYTHKNIKKILVDIIGELLNIEFNKFFNNVGEFIKEIEKMIKELNSWGNNFKFKLVKDENGIYMYGSGFNKKIQNMNIYLKDMIYKIDDNFTYIGAIFVDLFFLRRFLDKDYITNGIVYCGAYHSINYIYILSKYFDFKVTHVSYSKYDINKINNLITKSKHPEELNEYFWPEELVQCTKLTDFPELFT